MENQNGRLFCLFVRILALIRTHGHIPTKKRPRIKKALVLSFSIVVCVSLHVCVLFVCLFATPLSTTAGGAGQQAEGLLVFHYFMEFTAFRNRNKLA